MDVIGDGSGTPPEISIRTVMVSSDVTAREKVHEGATYAMYFGISHEIQKTYNS